MVFSSIHGFISRYYYIDTYVSEWSEDVGCAQRTMIKRDFNIINNTIIILHYVVFLISYDNTKVDSWLFFYAKHEKILLISIKWIWMCSAINKYQTNSIKMCVYCIWRMKICKIVVPLCCHHFCHNVEWN